MTDFYWHVTSVQTEDMDANEDADQDKSTRFVCFLFISWCITIFEWYVLHVLCV